MKVVIAIDSFKGSISSIKAGEAAKQGVLAWDSEAEVTVLPLADGGEGTTHALTYGRGEIKEVTVYGPLGMPVKGGYGILRDKGTAVIEMAQAAGLTLLSPGERNPLITTTYGVGEMIRDAIGEGLRSFIIGIGGSATNDGGAGMLMALGFEFYDKNMEKIGPGGIELARLAHIKTENALPELKDCVFHIACDVENPLCGPLGASAVYGPQKGADEKMVRDLDGALAVFAKHTENLKGQDYSQIPGTGAAGGLGFAFVAYLNGQLRSGVEIVLDELEINQHLEGADVVITGEGRIDRQTAMGKAPMGVAKRAKAKGALCIGIAGCVTDDALECNQYGLDGIFSITDGAMTLEESMEEGTAGKNITKTVSQLMRIIGR